MVKSLRQVILLSAWFTFSFLYPSFSSASSQYRDYIIGTYNVENFWDQDPENTSAFWQKFLAEHAEEGLETDRPLQYTDYSIESSNWYTAEIARAKIDSVIKTIKLSGTPDIFALQEFESAGNNSQVFQTPYSSSETFEDKLRQLGYQYFYIGEQSGPVSVTTAFISKVELNTLPSVLIRFAKFSTSARDIQVMEWKLNDDERVLLFNGHWKSKLGNNSDELRVQIAEKIKQRISEEKNKNPFTHFIVLGDLNAAYWEKPLTSLGATGDEREMLKEKTDFLYNLWAQLPEQQRWEQVFDGVRGTLSHILISDSLYQTEGFFYKNKSFQVIGHDGDAKQQLLTPDGHPFRWQLRRSFTKAVHIGKGFSDHLPLVAHFRYTEKNGSGFSTKQDIKKPTVEELSEPQDINIAQSDLCLDSEELYAYSDPRFIPMEEKLLGKCLKLDGHFELRSRGKNKISFIELPLGKKGAKKITVSVMLNRTYDWRPNIDDRRVTPAAVKDASKSFSRTKPHPQSNKCFNQRVLSGEGGVLNHAIGRLGYHDGYLTLFIRSREPSELVLSNLTVAKQRACPF